MSKYSERILCTALAAQRKNVVADGESTHPFSSSLISSKYKNKMNAEYQSILLERCVNNPLPLHEAINLSISQCENPDVRKRMYATMLVVGGTHLIRGLVPVLEYR